LVDDFAVDAVCGVAAHADEAERAPRSRTARMVWRMFESP